MSDTKGEAKGGLTSNTLTNSQTQYTNFLFGENLADRVLLPAKEETSNDTTKKEETEHDENGEHSATQKLPEKRKYEVITGEEDESNVLQIFCKLYLWDSTSAFWKEKGKGMLRLNDKMKDDKICSRLVMRTAGSLKVILNASIVPGMKFELSNENCLRFINIDGIYLFKGKEKDIEQLNSVIESRLRELSKKVKVDDNGETTQDTVNNESSLEKGANSTEDSKKEEETKQLKDSEGSQLNKELEKNEDSDENSRKENVPEEDNKTVEQKDDHEDKELEQQSNSKTETNNTNNNNTEETSTSPPDLDQK